MDIPVPELKQGDMLCKVRLPAYAARTCISSDELP